MKKIIVLFFITIIVAFGIFYYCTNNSYSTKQNQIQTDKPAPATAVTKSSASETAITNHSVSDTAVADKSVSETAITNDSDTAVASRSDNPDTEADTSSLLPDDISSITDNNETVPLDTMPSSYTVLVNRDHLLPKNYVPDDLVYVDIPFDTYGKKENHKMRKAAAKAVKALISKAKKNKLNLFGISAFRSYKRQKDIYKRNIKHKGKEKTDYYSAEAGSSEHQTGLTIDLSTRSIGYDLVEALAHTKEGKWLEKNCYKYGFIIRYPKGKEKITGYKYEPWHIRYVGKNMAKYLYQKNLTLEEYYGIVISKGEKK